MTMALVILSKTTVVPKAIYDILRVLRLKEIISKQDRQFTHKKKPKIQTRSLTHA